MKLFLDEPFASLWEGSDAFEQAFSLSGETYRDMGDRCTSRFEVGGKGYFIKTHSGVGVAEMIKNWVYLRRPVLGAGNEYEAILRFKSLGVDTMTAVAYGERGSNPAQQQSFLITEALEPTQPLDEYCTPSVLKTMGPGQRRALVRRIADIARQLHDNGVNHRDFYLCHFLLDTHQEVSHLPPSQRRIYMIDLHRAQMRDRTPRRWRMKDLSALYYSAKRVGFDQRDVLAFLKHYKQQSLHQVVSENASLWAAVEKDAKKLYIKGVRKGYHD